MLNWLWCWLLLLPAWAGRGLPHIGAVVGCGWPGLSPSTSSTPPLPRSSVMAASSLRRNCGSSALFFHSGEIPNYVSKKGKGAYKYDLGCEGFMMEKHKLCFQETRKDAFKASSAMQHVGTRRLQLKRSKEQSHAHLSLAQKQECVLEGNQNKTLELGANLGRHMRAALEMDKNARNLAALALENFSKIVRRQMLGVNVLLMVNAILMGVMVGIGAYGHRYHHPLTRFLFKGATLLFLPIVSYIVSTTGRQFNVAVPSLGGTIAVGDCDPSIHTALVLVWTAFVQIIGINTTVIVAADVREGRSIAPPAALLVQAMWTTYLAGNIMLGPDPEPLSLKGATILPMLVVFAPFALIFAKIFLKYYAWYSAKHSFSFGRNPCLIVGYMVEQPPAEDDHSQHIPPPLIVSGEDTMVVGTQPHSYRIMCSSGSAGCSLVTLDKVWELDDTLLKSIAQLKDVCFSFALFKLLRCRFAKFIVVAEEARNFLWHVLLEDSDGTRTFRVIATELSFLHDYYYSSLHISYSKDWLPISSIFISLLSIGYCFFGTIALRAYLSDLRVEGQIRCDVSYRSNHDHVYMFHDNFGSLSYDVVPLLLLDALVVLSEVREIASYICSDWTKVALMCRYVSWREYPTLRRWIGLLLQCRCKLLRPWKDNMNQCSIIVLHPRKLALLRRITPLPEQKKSVKVPREVKAAIVDTLRSSSSRGDGLRNGNMSWQQLGIQVGDNFLRAHSAQGTTDTLLAWHIATTIFEVRNPHTLASSSGSVATHLSRYCAYLVAHSPGLLPDNDAWSSSLYKATKKGAERALCDAVPTATPELEYRQLVELLSAAGSQHEVLKEGSRLGEQLVELMKEEEEAAWKALARFWCEMILYMAPSDNLDGHAVAVARGGELITLLWALLTHVSIPEAAGGSSTTRLGASPDMV